MTEAEWLRCEDPFSMLDCVNPESVGIESRAASDRKLRLFGALCCRLIWNSMWEGCRPGVEAAERFAEGEHDPKLLAVASRVCLGHSDAYRSARSSVDWVIAGDSGPLDLSDLYQKDLAARATGLAREVFGNPFRPVTVDPGWLTSDVCSLARGIYDERAFDRMPILADALQDAGCANNEVLSHCRDANQVHVRGCWVVDLLLGKC